MSFTLGAAEREREILQERLLRTREPLIRFSKLAGFLEHTYQELTPRDQWSAFVQPLIEDLITLATPTLLSQQPPDKLASLEQIFLNLESRELKAKLLKDIQEARLTQALYCGDIETAYSLLDIQPISVDEITTPLEIAIRLVGNCQDTKLQQFGIEFCKQWQELRVSKSSSAVHVLLLTPEDAYWGSHGVLTALELIQTKNAALQHFQFDHVTEQVDSALLSLDSATRAASRWLSRELGFKDSSSAVLKLRDVSAAIEGPSLGLAIAGLCVCDGIEKSLTRRQFRFSSTVALTSAIDEEGRVQPVEGIREKATRAFYSPVEYLGVPFGQEKEAEQTIQELCARYPHRELSVIPIRSLDDLFSQRRLVADYQVPLPKHAVRQLERFPRWAQVGLALIALIILIYAPISYYYPNTRFWIDRTPALWDATNGQDLIVMNKERIVLWKFSIGNHWQVATDEALKVDYEGLVAAKSNQGMLNYRYCRFADADGDGRKEVFFLDPNRDAGSPMSGPEVLYCLSDRGKLLWKRVLDHPGYEPYVQKDTGNPMIAGALRWIDIDWQGHGKSNLILSQRDASSSGSARAYLEEIDGSTGQTLHIFKHMQWLFSLTAVPEENSKKQTVWAGGLNNESFPELFVFRDSIRSRTWPCEDTTGFIGARFPICDVYVNKEQPGWLRSISLCDSNLIQITICNPQVRSQTGDYCWKGYHFRVHQNLHWHEEEMIKDDWTQLWEFIHAGVIPMPESPETWLAPNTYAEIWTGREYVPLDSTRPKPDPYPIFSAFDPRLSNR